MRAVAALLLGLSLSAAPAGADGQPGAVGQAPAAPQASTMAPAPAAPQAPSAPMVFNMLHRPVESQEAAFRESIRQAARAPEAGPDGAIRLGGATLSIVVKDACPDGEPFHDMGPLVQRPRPGRTRR